MHTRTRLPVQILNGSGTKDFDRSRFTPRALCSITNSGRTIVYAINIIGQTANRVNTIESFIWCTCWWGEYMWATHTQNTLLLRQTLISTTLHSGRRNSARSHTRVRYEIRTLCRCRESSPSVPTNCSRSTITPTLTIHTYTLPNT